MASFIQSCLVSGFEKGKLEEDFSFACCFIQLSLDMFDRNYLNL